MTATPFLFSFFSLLAAGAGGYSVLAREGWEERHLWRLLAFGSGVFLSTTLLHLLPEAWELSAASASGAVLAALVLFPVAEEFTVFHACGDVAEHGHAHPLGHGVLAALFFHSLADGLAVAFSFLSSPHLGRLVSSAVLIHKFTDGMTLSTLFLGAGRSRKGAAFLTALLALATPLGVLGGLAMSGWVGPKSLAALLGLAGGGFLYVSMADILPRLHRRKDGLCWMFLLLGAGLSAVFSHH